MSTDLIFHIDKEGSELKESNIAIGIDLGTTNSCASIVRLGVLPEIIPIEGKATIPSCVTWEGGDNFIVGSKSYEQRYKENSIYSVKRLMGTDKKITLKYKGEEITLTPEEVSAKILRKIVDEVNKDYGNVRKVVVTVPANFNMNQIKATRKACEIAGLELLKLLKEPTSAAILNTATTDLIEKNILVYDLGGGTFDISLVSVRKTSGVTKELKDFLKIYGIEKEETANKQSAVQVKYTDGDMQLGGDNIDYIFSDLTLKSLGIDINSLENENREKFILMMEKSKKSILPTTSTELNFTFKFKDGKEENKVFSLNYELFIKSTDMIFEKTKNIIDKAIEENPDIPIDSIVLVGGSTKNKVLKELIRKSYPSISVSDGLEPDESVALGAGITARELTLKDSSMKIFDVIQAPIGILKGNKIENMLPKDTPIPSSVIKRFVTENKEANILELELYEGKSEIPADCTKIGTLNIRFDNEDKTIKTVTIKIKVTINGLIEVTTVIDGKETTIPLRLDGKKEEENIPKKFLKWKELILTMPSENLIRKCAELWNKALKGDKTSEKELAKEIKKHATLFKPSL